MGRAVRAKAPRTPAPVDKVELSDKHLPLRIAAAVFFLVVGASALAYSVSSFFTGEKGWREIGTLESDGITCAQDFSFMYNIGLKKSVSAENRELTELYSHAAKKSYEIFNTLNIDGVNNLWTINHSQGEAVEVDPVLYDALEKISKSGDRTLYLGPAYEIYNGLFKLEFKDAAPDYDPQLNPELAELFRNICRYAADPEQVDVKLLGDNRVRLDVSDEYASLLSENELENVIDFSWMKNAFIIDYFAEEIASAGYTDGAISSDDGFSVSLGGQDTSFTVFHMCEDGVYPIGVMNYKERRSVVYLRDYVMSEGDIERYFTLNDGEVRTPYLDIADGFSRQSTHDITAYSDGFSCADIVLELAGLYCTSEFDEDRAKALAGDGVYLIYGDGGAVYYTAQEDPLSEKFEESRDILVMRVE